jgi:hypothetical protein
MRKTFKHGERVKVTLPKKRPFYGTVYSEYTNPHSMRRICINVEGTGCGVAFPVMFVKKLRPSDAWIRKHLKGE